MLKSGSNASLNFVKLGHQVSVSLELQRIPKKGWYRLIGLNYQRKCSHIKVLILKILMFDRHPALYLPLMGINLVKPWLKNLHAGLEKKGLYNHVEFLVISLFLLMAILVIFIYILSVWSKAAYWQVCKRTCVIYADAGESHGLRKLRLIILKMPMRWDINVTGNRLKI